MIREQLLLLLIFGLNSINPIVSTREPFAYNYDESFIQPDTPLQMNLLESLPFNDKDSLVSLLEKNMIIPKQIASNNGDDDYRQVVYINFIKPDKRIGLLYRFNIACLGAASPSGDPTTYPGLFIHTYTDTQKKEIVDRIKKDFEKFDVEFLLERPPSGIYSTLTFNAIDINFGNPNLSLYADCSMTDPVYSGTYSVLFGEADGIDFRNKVHADNARVDANFVKVMAAILPRTFKDLFGISGEDDTISPEDISDTIIALSAKVGSHEVGHLLVSSSISIK